MRVSSRPRRCANMIGAGISSRRFVAGVTEHQALVARALLRRSSCPWPCLRVHALRDVGRLLRHDDVDEHLVRVKHVVVVDVADFADGVAGDLHEVELGLGGDLAADDGDVGLHVGFAGDAAELVLREAGVQHGVGNGVGDFVRMAFADGLGRKDERFCSCNYCSVSRQQHIDVSG